MRLTCLGAAGEVTGSCYLVEAGGVRFLMDCGMFQGRDAQRKNSARFQFDPRDIAFVLLSHAHIDHSGLLPRLVAAGFRGSIYATAATCDLLGVLLPDSAYLQAREVNRKGGRNDAPSPLYTIEEARLCLRQLVPVEYGVAIEPGPGIRCLFHDAGHILGSAILEVKLLADGRGDSLVFSGDVRAARTGTAARHGRLRGLAHGARRDAHHAQAH